MHCSTRLEATCPTAAVHGNNNNKRLKKRKEKKKKEEKSNNKVEQIFRTRA
jgi:hypothetical protein